MNFLTAAQTDIGTRKKTNQDSLLIMQASTDRGQVLLASVCDGMGGLAKGEVASAAMVAAIKEWFNGSFPQILEAYEGIDFEVQLQKQWKALIDETNEKIGDYGRLYHTNLGTTVVILLIVGETYYVLNVGDSRIYLLSDQIYQLTKDQTYVQREMDAGRMTLEQAMVSPQRSILLQCVGASSTVEPEFSKGVTEPGQVFMLCCDGFRHVVMPDEFYQAFYPAQMNSREIMEKKMRELIRLNIDRREDDNISVILVKTC